MPAPEPGERWGVLGGAFDPVHLGHLTLAREILTKSRFNGFLFVPTLDPPHRPRQPVAGFEERVAMLELALARETAMAISRIEKNTPRPSYTLNTVRALKDKYAGVEFIFTIGADNVSLFKTWYCWEQLLSEIRLIVVNRPGVDLSDLSLFPSDRFELLEITPSDLSSTIVRDRIRQGATREQLAQMVTVPVADYIFQRGLYR